MLVKPATYPDSRISRIQWRDRAGVSPASRASLRPRYCGSALGLLLLLALCACAGSPPRHVLPRHPRIVALMPVFVDDLVAIGAAHQIAGVSSGTEDIPQVRSVARVADFASVDVERIVALHPDLVVAIPAQMRFLRSLSQTGIEVVTLPDDAYGDIFSNLRRLGALSGHERAASAEVAALRKQTARIVSRRRRFAVPPSVFVVIGVQPIWTVGSKSYIAALVRLAGGRDAAALGSDYGEYSAEALLRAQPDVIISDPSTDIGTVLGREPWRSLRAVQQHRVFIVPDASLIERPGPRYVRGLAWLVRQFRAMKL